MSVSFRKRLKCDFLPVIISDSKVKKNEKAGWYRLNFGQFISANLKRNVSILRYFKKWQFKRHQGLLNSVPYWKTLIIAIPYYSVIDVGRSPNYDKFACLSEKILK